MHRLALSILGSAGLLLGGCVTRSAAGPQWKIEAEQAAFVTFGDVIDIETPAGLSLWYTRELRGPVAIDFDALAVSEGGANDAVSDLNAFWMARDPRVRGGSVFAKKRSGAFAAYDDLETYYVGIGGNRNTTTRFRRYVGEPGNRPLLPEHDLSGAAHMLVPNRWTHVRLIADGRRIAVERDGQQLFALDDPQPYRRGWFALRTTKSHLRIRNLRIGKP
ncbi:DUF6250 domain-containing protein [Sphingomonas psychrotolerans]|uniref:DUF6250 domain-containing protein n=1 Tax=Sphingomonas psychrotolerans TaxID=1327635 RepID=A0ABU3N2P8_9SPHN|nr:DUF6250 domain-containing protein [Sphingomonas psychrotolerans]MDT8758815.1 DUF6250 domain-containing protein [Sphingomonas psychrotolerans]